MVHPHLADKNFGQLPFRWSKWGLVQMGLVQLGVVQMRVVQMCTFTFTFLKASKVIIDFQYFTNNILSQFWWRFPILHKPFFLFGTESTMWLRKLKGWLVGVWDGTNLGWIPTGNLLSQFHPKIPMIRRCSTILPMHFWWLLKSQSTQLWSLPSSLSINNVRPIASEFNIASQVGKAASHHAGGSRL